MSFWIIILCVGIMLTIIGMITWTKEYKLNRYFKNSALISGIFLPLLFASFYADTLINDFFTGPSLIDLGGLYFIGMISGFFTAFYFLNRKISDNGRD